MNAAVERARALLEDVTPLPSDCGRLCGAACCRADEGAGVYLFPGEDAAAMPWGRVGRGALGDMLLCDGMCDRGARPLACRFFPLTCALREGGAAIRMDARAKGLCPLTASGLKGLSPAFRDAVKRAFACLMEDDEARAFLERWQAEEEAYRREEKRLREMF